MRDRKGRGAGEGNGAVGAATGSTGIQWREAKNFQFSSGIFRAAGGARGKTSRGMNPPLPPRPASEQRASGQKVENVARPRRGQDAKLSRGVRRDAARVFLAALGVKMRRPRLLSSIRRGGRSVYVRVYQGRETRPPLLDRNDPTRSTRSARKTSAADRITRRKLTENSRSTRSECFVARRGRRTRRQADVAIYSPREMDGRAAVIERCSNVSLRKILRGFFLVPCNANTPARLRCS